MNAHASRTAASDDIAAAAVRLRGTPDQLAARLRTLLDDGAPRPGQRETTEARRDREADAAAHEHAVAALRHRLAGDFAEGRGWTATTAPLSVKEVARRASPGGNWHKPAREWLGSLFSLSFYRDGRRRACAAVAHLMAEQVDREREAIKLWAAERELAATFPDVPSWQNPGRAVVVVLQPAEVEEVGDKVSGSVAVMATTPSSVEPEAAMSQISTPLEAFDQVTKIDMGQLGGIAGDLVPSAMIDFGGVQPEAASDPVEEVDMATPENADAEPAPDLSSMRPVAPVDLNGVVPRDLTDEQDPDFDVVDPSELLIDERYQRGLSPKSLALIRGIVERWSWSKFKVPTCVRIEGRLCVVDGQHTAIAAASHPGIGAIPVLIAKDPEVADHAAAFLSHSRDRLKATAVQLHRAALTAGDPEAVALDAVCRAAGVELLPFPAGRGTEYAPRQSVAVVSIRRLIEKRGPERATEILATLAAADLAPIAGDHIRLAELLLCDEAYTGGFDAEGLSAALRGLTARTHAEARELAIAQRLAPWRALAAVLYRNRTKPVAGRRRAAA